MKHVAISIALMLAFAAPVLAQDTNTNTNTLTNTVTIGKPVAITPPKSTAPAKPVKVTAPTPAKPATPTVKKTPLATSSATGGASTVSVNSDATSSSNATGGAGGAGGTATAGSVTVNNGGWKHSAASPTAPAIYTNAECANAASGSVTTGVFGLAFGATSDNTACNARQDFSILSANDLPNAAAASMCLGTRAQRVAIEAEGVDCEILTKGEVKTVKAGGFDIQSYCQEPVGDWERFADRAKVCANLR